MFKRFKLLRGWGIKKKNSIKEKKNKSFPIQTCLAKEKPKQKLTFLYDKGVE